jgi:two-component system, sensor histidine kinase PdtaS
MIRLPYCFIPAFLLIVFSCKFTGKDKDLQTKLENDLPDTTAINATIRDAVKHVRKEPDSIINLLEPILKQLANTTFDNGNGEIYWLLGQAYFYKYRYDSALLLYNQANLSFSRAGNKKGMAKVQLSKSYAYSARQELQQALSCAETGLHLYEGEGDFDMVYECLDGLIYLYKQLNNPRAVDSLVNRLPLVAEKTRNQKKVAGSFITLGNHYLDQAYLNLAIEAFYKALRMAEEANDPLETANAKGSIALANLYLHEYTIAINYYLEQEKILKERNDLYELGKTYTGLGEAYNALKDFSRGLEYHNRSLDISKKLNFLPSIGNALQNIGFTYYLMHDSMDKALEYVRQSMQINRDISNYGKLADNYLLSGRIYLLKNSHTRSIRYLEQSLALARRYNNPQVIMDASGLLSILYARRKDFQRAYANLLINNQISDSLISGENLKRITQLEMQRNFDNKQNETNLIYLQETLRFEARLRKNRLFRNSLITAGLLITGFGAFLLYSYRKTVRAEREKEALLKEIHHRVKNNLMVISSLLNLQSGSITDDQTRNAVRESQNRVKSMALIHQLLYQSELFTGIDFSEYLEQLMQSLQNTYSKPGRSIRYIIRAEPVKLDIDTAIPLGLITNELVTNAYKYAFVDNGSGTIEVSLTETLDHNYSLQISDDGKGLPDDFDPEESPSLGLRLVKILAKQIKARMAYLKGKGTVCQIVFPAAS